MGSRTNQEHYEVVTVKVDDKLYAVILIRFVD